MKKRLLFLSLSPSYQPDSPAIREKYELLSERYCGDIFPVVGDRKYDGRRVADFVVRGLFLPRRLRYAALPRDVIYTIVTIIRAVYLHYARHRYDAIIAPEPLICGVIALILGRATGAKVIIEVNGQFESAFKYSDTPSGVKMWLKERYVKVAIPFALKRADAVKLLHPVQVQAFVESRRLKNVTAFADFVPIRQFGEGKGSSKSLLFVGYPWLLKGVDILIKAFNQVTTEFPEWSLKVVGYCPDRTLFVALANGNPRIILADPVPANEVVQLMAECSIFVLPSRTEAMGRVLLEAMASKKPIIASNVDGIPFVVTHEQNGLLFESENVGQLAAMMRRLMSDPSYAQRLGDNGFERVHRELSEQRYLEKFSEMIDQVSAS
jgi:glycosyltransferase involved in cell wall biosynthesis